MASEKKKGGGGPGFPLNLLNDAANIIAATHGDVTPTSPLKSAQDLTQQEQSYAPGDIKTGLSAANTALTGVGDVTNTIGKALGFLTNGENWVRLLEVIAGFILVAMGLHQLTGAGGTIVNVAKKAATAGRA